MREIDDRWSGVDLDWYEPAAGEQFAKAPHWLLDANLGLDAEGKDILSPLAKWTYVVINRYINRQLENKDKGSSWPGMARLGQMVGVKETKLREAIAQLRNLDILIVKRRGQGKTNLYRLRLCPSPRFLTLAQRGSRPAPTGDLDPRQRTIQNLAGRGLNRQKEIYKKDGSSTRASALTAGAAAPEPKKWNKRPSGIITWYPSDEKEATRIEAMHARAEIEQVCVRLWQRYPDDGPLPTRVRRELERRAREEARRVAAEARRCVEDGTAASKEQARAHIDGYWASRGGRPARGREEMK